MRNRPMQILILGVVFTTGCMPAQSNAPKITPALNYARKVGGGNVPGFDPPRVRGGSFQSSASTLQQNGTRYPEAQFANSATHASPGDRAQLRMVKDLPPEERSPYQQGGMNMGADPDLSMMPDVEVYRSQRPNVPDYNGPLSLGDPGVTSSLWRSSKRGNDLFQDDRAWQPYDLVTIVISENAEGTKEADTEVKTSSSILAAITNFLGYEADLQESNSNLDLSNIINATTSTDYKGEGDTSRRGSLQARLSAMVVEVLPGGVLRVEGEKIISVNNEEEVMVISGLVRPRDINSLNEVNSSKVAQLRVDFYGEGAVNSAQGGGWLGNLFRSFWPF